MRVRTVKNLPVVFLYWSGTELNHVSRLNRYHWQVDRTHCDILTRVSGMFAYSFWTDSHIANYDYSLLFAMESGSTRCPAPERCSVIRMWSFLSILCLRGFRFCPEPSLSNSIVVWRLNSSRYSCCRIGMIFGGGPQCTPFVASIWPSLPIPSLYSCGSCLSPICQTQKVDSRIFVYCHQPGDIVLRALSECDDYKYCA
jgi:hypothetical protein